MPSTYSPNLRLELIATGEKQGTWGATTNVNLGTLLEEAIGGYTSVTVSDAGDTTLTTNNGSADQSRNMVLNLTGTISAARNVICPAIEKLYVVKNATTGGYAVTIKVSGQTGVSIPNGSTVFVYVDGTDVRAITGSAALQSIGTSGATVPLLNGTNTWSSSQTFSASINTFGSNSNPTSVYVSGGTSTNKGVFFQTTGLNRWSVFSNGVAESGAGAGSNFGIGRYDDSGAAVDSPLIINRATGVTTIAQLALTTPLAIAQGGTGATSNSAARTNLGLGTAATQNTGTSGTNVPLLDGVNTWSGAQTFSATGTAFGSNSASINNISVNAAANTSRILSFLSNGSSRWVSGVNNAAESGSNAGSNFVLNRYDDSGALIDTTMTVNRSTGVTSFKEVALNTPLAIVQGGTGATSNSAARTNLGLGTISTQDASAVAITGGTINSATITGGTINAASIINGTIVANASSLSIRDADASNILTLAVGSNLTANTVLTLTTGAATSRTLDISASNVTITVAGANLVSGADASAQRTTLGLGTASTLNVGTSANNIVQLDGSARLPAVDGSQLTNLPVQASTGRLLRAPQNLTSGTSYTTPAGCTAIYVEAVGAGGAGQAGGSNPSGGGGGGSGGYAGKYFSVTANTAYTYAIGAGGATAGASGGNTTFTVGATTITAGGGTGGGPGGNTALGGPGGTATNGDVNVPGSPGGPSVSSASVGGNGGSSFFGGGGLQATAGSSGGGGGGGYNAGGGLITQGNGGAGRIRIWEYA